MSTEETEMEPTTKSYRIREGQIWPLRPELAAGEVVELTDEEAAPYLDVLELVEEEEPPADEAAAE